MRLDPRVWSRIPAADGLLWHSALALLSALLLLLSFPAYDLHYLAWIALAPLLFALGQEISRRRAFWLGWLTGLIWVYFAENWIAHSMIFFGDFLAVLAYGIALLFAAILALFPALFAVAVRQLVKTFGWAALASAPLAWVGAEWLRQWVTGVTWNALGISQVSNFQVARLARHGGVYLVSAEIVAVTAALVLATRLKQRNVGRMASALALAAALVFFLPATDAPIQGAAGAQVTVAGIQPNLPPDGDDGPEAFSRNLENNIRLTREVMDRAPGKSVDLVIWAESPLALFYENDPALRTRLDSLAQETGSYFMLNTVAREGERYFNSINLIDPRPEEQGTGLRPVMKRYDKIRLVPFGEYVPYRSVLGRFVPTIVGDFTAGRAFVVNLLRLETKREAMVTAESGTVQPSIERTTNFIRVGGFICYEAAYPDLVRGFVKNGATLLVNVSNDAWFGNTAGARQHLAHARMRAIETDRDLIRVTNSGISALLTAEGKVIEQLPPFIAGAQLWQAQARRNLTPYVRHGDWFAVACLGLTILLSVGSILYARRAR